MINKIKSVWYNQSADVKMLGKGVFWSMFGSMISRGLLFLAWVIIARILGKEQYGEYGLIRNTVMMFATFAGSGMGQAATKFVAEFFYKDRSKAERIAALIARIGVITGSIIFIVAFLLSPYIAKDTINAPWLVNEFRIASLVLLFSTINSVQVGVLEGLGLFKKVASINTFNGIVSLPLFVLGAYYGGVYGSVVAYCLSIILLCVLSSWHIRKQKQAGYFTFNYKYCWQERRIILSFILPTLLTGIMLLPIKWVADVLLVNNSGFSQMGVFTAAMTINVILNSIAVMLNAPFLNIISKTKNQNNLCVERLNIFAPWLMGIFFTFPLIMFPELGGVIFGKEYAGEQFNQVFIFILVYTLITMYKQGFARLLVLHNLQWIALCSNILWGIGLIGSFILLKSQGAVGLSISYVVSMALSTVVVFPYYLKKKYICRQFVVSSFVITIWGITILIVGLAFLKFSVFWNLLICTILLFVTLYMFCKEFKKI